MHREHLHAKHLHEQGCTYGDIATMLPDTAEKGLRVTEERLRAALGLFITGEHSVSFMTSNCLGESTVVGISLVDWYW